MRSSTRLAALCARSSTRLAAQGAPRIELGTYRSAVDGSATELYTRYSVPQPWLLLDVLDNFTWFGRVAFRMAFAQGMTLVLECGWIKGLARLFFAAAPIGFTNKHLISLSLLLRRCLCIPKIIQKLRMFSWNSACVTTIAAMMASVLRIEKTRTYAFLQSMP